MQGRKSSAQLMPLNHTTLEQDFLVPSAANAT